MKVHWVEIWLLKLLCFELSDIPVVSFSFLRLFEAIVAKSESNI